MGATLFIMAICVAEHLMAKVEHALVTLADHCNAVCTKTGRGSWLASHHLVRAVTTKVIIQMCILEYHITLGGSLKRCPKIKCCRFDECSLICCLQLVL